MHYNVEETSKRIKKARVEKGYTQAIMAEKLGIHTNTYQRIESGKMGVSIDLILLIGEEFGLSLDYLLKGVVVVRNQEFESIIKDTSEKKVKFALKMLKSIFDNLEE